MPLTLTRRVGESIIIGQKGEIRVTVVEICGNQVRIAVQAPREVKILRNELVLLGDPEDYKDPDVKDILLDVKDILRNEIVLEVHDSNDDDDDDDDEEDEDDDDDDYEEGDDEEEDDEGRRFIPLSQQNASPGLVRELLSYSRRRLGA